MSSKHNTFCRVCEPSCALIAEVENDEIISLLPDRDHPVTKGFACTRVWLHSKFIRILIATITR